MFLLAVFVAFVGAATLNIGKGVQKMNVRVFAQGWGMFKPPHRRRLGLWTVGLAMTASFGPCQWLALQIVDNPSLTSSMMGVGLVGLVLFAVKVIGERLARRELLGIGLIIVSTFALVYFQEHRDNPQRFDLVILVTAVAAATGFAALLAVFSLLTRRLHGFAFGFLAGTVNGIALVLVKVGAVDAGSGELAAQLADPWLYLGLLFGIGATVFTQVGFWRDRALIVVPTYTSLTIMTPAVLEYFVFGFNLVPTQYGALVCIVAGVIVLCSGASEEALSGDFLAARHEDA